MKFFNHISATLMALTLCAGFTACEDEADYVAAGPESGSKAYFATSNPAKVELQHEENASFSVLLSRNDDAAEATISFTAECSKPEVFSIPTSVTFAAGSKEAAIVIAYNGLELDYNEPVDFSFHIGEEFQSLYAISDLTFTGEIPAPWKSLGKALYQDDCLAPLYGQSPVMYEVEIQEHALQPGLFRLVNAYGAAHPMNEPGDYDTEDHYFEINATDPDHVWLTSQLMGVDWGNGELTINSFVQYNIDNGATLEQLIEQAPQYFGTYKDGIITMPAKSLLLALGEDGWYYGNTNGAFLIAMPGVTIADYSAELAYAGKLYDVEDNLYIVASATLGSDVEEISLAVCAAGEEEALAAELAAGNVENAVTLSASGNAQLPFDAEAATGKYSIVGVTFAGGEAQKSCTTTFRYTSLNGEPAESWTAYFTGINTFNVLFNEPEEQEATLFGSDDDPTGVRCKVAPWIDGEEGVTFAWPNETEIMMDGDQYVSFDDEEGEEILVADMSAPCSLVNGAATWAEIVKSNFGQYLNGTEDEPSFVDVNTMNFNVIYYSASGGVYGWGFDSFEAKAQAQAQARIAAPTEYKRVLDLSKRPLYLHILDRNAARAF